MELGHGFGETQLFGLHDWNTEAECRLFYCRWNQVPAAPCRAIRLGYHPDKQVMPGKRLQRRDGEIRRTHKDDARLISHLLFYCLFLEIG